MSGGPTEAMLNQTRVRVNEYDPISTKNLLPRTFNHPDIAPGLCLVEPDPGMKGDIQTPNRNWGLRPLLIAGPCQAESLAQSRASMGGANPFPVCQSSVGRWH